MKAKRKKTAPLKVMLSPETKKKFLEKCRESGLSLTGFIERVAEEPIIFLDQNAKVLLEALNLLKK